MKRRTTWIVVIIGCMAAAASSRVRNMAAYAVDRMGGRKSIADRAAQYGAAVRGRLQADFLRAGCAYPPRDIVLVGLKQERRLEVWVAGDADAGQEARADRQNARLSRHRLLRQYPILAASGVAGPKLREGDKQVPEGLYRVESLNPNSRFHLSLRLNYPNEFDRQMAARDGRTRPGSDIMIHGCDVSIGCLAMGDEAAEELFILAADAGLENVHVILSPVDFRRADARLDTAGLPAWTPGLYEQLRAALRDLASEQRDAPAKP